MLIEEIYQEFLASSGVSIDSRTIQPNQVFFALTGTKVDGRDFVSHALHKGARLAIVEDPKLGDQPGCILVVSTLDTLQRLARYHREQLKIPVLAITGSVGKTTTKELIYAVLSTAFRTCFTKGNLNNHIGVPLTILSIDSAAEIAIIEMGANHIGEIEFLCTIAKPTHGLITAIGKAHLEGFGSLKGVIIAKTELFHFLQHHQGIAFINDQDEMLVSISRGFEMEKIYTHANMKSGIIAMNPFLSLEVQVMDGPVTTISTLIPGKYNLQNIETAICIGLYFGVPLDKIASGIERYESTSNRSQLLKIQSNTFILDAYNANPVSMAAAITSFAELKTEDHKILVLGEMRELGSYSANEHQYILNLIQSHAWKAVILVGQQFIQIPADPAFHYFNDVLELKPWFKQQAYRQSIFLVKGSRGVALEKLFEADQLTPDSGH